MFLSFEDWGSDLYRNQQVPYAVISLWHMSFLSPPTKRVLLPHFPLTQSELSLHNLQAWTPSSVRFGGFIICYILVVLENGDCYWCWNQCWKNACLPVGDRKRQRRPVWCEMEVMVSLSFSSKYYQLIFVNKPHCCKFLLNLLSTNFLSCLFLLPWFTYCSCLSQRFPLRPLFPMCLWHQDVASLPPHIQHSSHPGWPRSSLPVTQFGSSTSPGKLWLHHKHRQQPWQRLLAWPRLSVPDLQGAWCHQHLPRSHPGWPERC